jgi:hypothetical protein
MRKHVLAGQEHALRVDVVHPIPALLGGLDGTANADDPDIGRNIVRVTAQIFPRPT